MNKTFCLPVNAVAGCLRILLIAAIATLVYEFPALSIFLGVQQVVALWAEPQLRAS